MPTDCSAGPIAPAPPNSSAAPHAAQRAPAREDHQRHRDQALAAGDALVPAAGVEQRERCAAQAGDEAARRGGRDADARRPNSPARAWRWPSRPPCAPAGRRACRAKAHHMQRRASTTPIGTSALTCSAARTAGESLQSPSGDGGQLRRLRLDQRLAQVERQARCPAASARCRWRRR